MSRDMAPAPAGYSEWLTDIKAGVWAVRTRAALAANSEPVQLNWQIGQDILERQARQAWSSKVIERLVEQLESELGVIEQVSSQGLGDEE